jgi:diguanylate cyclase (GGDEF)-like protein
MAKIINSSRLSRGLNYKLRIAFWLMSGMPFLVMIYFLNKYILPQKGLTLEVILFIGAVIVVILSGFMLLREMFNRVLNISAQVKQLAPVDAGSNVSSSQLDEVGVLGETLDQLTQHIRLNMDELKTYSQKSSQINDHIQKHVQIFSHLLQVSSLISQGADLDEIITSALQKLRDISAADAAYLLFREETGESLFMRAFDARDAQDLSKVKMKSTESIFDNLVKTGEPLIMDGSHQVSAPLRGLFYQQFGLKNTLAVPVYYKGRLIGILGMGNRLERFSYDKDSIEQADIFAKQIGIAVENDRLINRIAKLEIKDHLTGLYNKRYAFSRLQEEIKRAALRQRPCALILLNIDDFQRFRESHGAGEAEERLKMIATVIREGVSEIDIVARIEDNEFAIILPEKNKREGEAIAEHIRGSIEEMLQGSGSGVDRLTVSGGIAENPLDGETAEELLHKAKASLAHAKQHGKNFITKG